MDYQTLLKSMTPAMVARLRQSLELGKWPDGRSLSPEQKETCLSAIIEWEARNVPESERTGFIDRSKKQQVQPPDSQVLHLRDD